MAVILVAASAWFCSSSQCNEDKFTLLFKTFKSLRDWYIFPWIFFTVLFITVGSKYISRNQLASLHFLRTQGASMYFKNAWDFFHWVVINCYGSHDLTLFLKVLPLSQMTSWFEYRCTLSSGIWGKKVENKSSDDKVCLILKADIKLPISPNMKVQNW